MFKVAATTLGSYFKFDPERETDLRAVDALIRRAAPSLTRWYVRGAGADMPGMKMNMIGYGHFFYTVKSSPKPIRWPIIGLALQKNHVSMYCSVRNAHGSPFILEYEERLGRVKVSAKGVVTFETADQLDVGGVGRMLRDLVLGLKAGVLQSKYGRVAT